MRYGLTGLDGSFNSYGGGSSPVIDPTFTPVRVTGIVLDDTHPRFKEVGEWNGIGTIFYLMVDAPLTENEENIGSPAKPIYPNLKHYPLINEIVYIVTLPDSTAQTGNTSTYNYYFPPLNVWNSQHHNALPNFLAIQNAQQDDYPKPGIRRVTDGSTEIDLGQTFVEKTNVNPLLPFEGDIINEGRWGNSIRFGSTVNGKTNWSETGKNGDPITIIRNGEDPNNGDEGWIPVVEDINNDISSIWMASTQQVPINVASSLYNSYSSPPDTPNQYAGSQIIINSDRVVLNSKTDHIMLSSAKSVSLNAIDSVNIDTKEHIVDADSILLGSKDATEHLMLGDTTVDMLGKILDEIIALSNTFQTYISLPAGSPVSNVNAQAVATSTLLNLYKNQLKTLLSTQNKTI